MKLFKFLSPAFLLFAACGNTDQSAKNFDEMQKNLGRVNTITPTDTVCYKAVQAQDTMLLHITTIGDSVKGILAYHHFEKDKSNGTFSGKMFGDTLKGNYHFLSEGTYSDMDKIFLKKDGKLLEASGEMSAENNGMRFTNPAAVAFGKSYRFEVVDCK